MGIDFSDLDDDGRPDIVTTTLSQEKYAVYYNAGDETFEYRTSLSNLGRATQLYAGWGVGVFDYDNNGQKDVFFANGHVMDNIERSQPHVRYLQPPLLLRHEGRRFLNVSEQGGPLFQRPWASRGAALGDLDNDGDVDLVVSNLNGPAYYARNRTNERGKANWIGLDLKGRSNNRDGLGARVTLTTNDGKKQYATATRAGSYLSSKDPRVHFGLGSNAKVQSIEIRWPSGNSQLLAPEKINLYVLVRESR